MDNNSIRQEKVMSQCLSHLPLEDFRSPLLDYGLKKLSTESLLKTFVAAQLGRWESYSDMEEKIRASSDLQKSLGLSSISGSQLSRRINDLPTEWVQGLFCRVVAKIQELTKDSTGLKGGIGKLRIVDSTHISLPAQLSSWAFVTKGWTVVKMHTRLVVASADTVFPDRILPSTGNVSDQEGSDVLIEESDATYVMDRGYISLKRMDQWMEKNISFVLRIKDNIRAVVRKEYDLPTDPSILRDAEVQIGKNHLRLVEYQDEKQRVYRIATTRRDLTATQIAEIYRNRWMIELFFKWIKQHLRLVKLYSTKPQGVWNQMFLALIAYGLALIVKLETQTKKTVWEVLRLLRTYAEKSWKQFLKELRRKPSRTSKGRQKVPKNKEPDSMPDPFVGTVAMVKRKNKGSK